MATCRSYPSLTAGDRLLEEPLAALGYRVKPVIWDNPGEDWGACAGVLIRSCWDYHLRPQSFLKWVSQMELAGVPLWNPPPVVRWNHDKRYLRKLSRAGLAVVPTVWVEPGQDHWQEQLRSQPWKDVVVKPAVSASAHGIWRSKNPTATGFLRRIEKTMEPHLIQPFLPEIVQTGEWSLVFLRGEYSHGVLKRAAPGDFRVQKEFGGSPEPTTPPQHLVEQAAQVLAAAPQPLLYARVDGVEIRGQFITLELELIEPDLFLETHPEAAPRLAACLVELLDAN